jgi:hypothetical protein
MEGQWLVRYESVSNAWPMFLQNQLLGAQEFAHSSISGMSERTTNVCPWVLAIGNSGMRKSRRNVGALLRKWMAINQRMTWNPLQERLTTFVCPFLRWRSI